MTASQPEATHRAMPGRVNILLIFQLPRKRQCDDSTSMAIWAIQAIGVGGLYGGYT